MYFTSDTYAFLHNTKFGISVYHGINSIMQHYELTACYDSFLLCVATYACMWINYVAIVGMWYSWKNIKQV